MKSKKKTAEIVKARQIAMHLCRKHTKTSLKGIGEAFGGRDHSTVIHALDIVAQQTQLDLGLRNAVDDIEKALKA